ncbi:MAG: DUF5667 domain-containing protein [Chloroflexi bacterium]|nr:DUF5667 domain-containing protein [Chloroflexota bacterium]
MPIKIEEAFNDCFERLSAGESLDSCLNSYPEYAAELDMMLRTTFDIKRRAYPVQPRPEFKYWARVRLQGVQDYVSRQPVQSRPSGFNLRRNLAISMAALLVFVIASSGTVAASSDSLPDEPLYGVKLAVEQAQVTLAFSDVDKAELYAHLAEKRAGEIVAMAHQGKTDKMETTTANMNYQLDQAEHFISKYEEANSAATGGEAAATSTAPSTTSTAPLKTDINPPDQSADTTAAPGGQQGNFTLPPKPLPPATRAATNISRAKNTMSATTAKSLAELQNALANAPDSAKPALLEVIQRTKQANIRAQQQLNLDNSRQTLPSGLTPNTIPAAPADKPKYIPPLNNNFKPVDPHPFNKPDLKNALPQGGENNQTGTTDNSDDNKYNRTNTVPDWNLPKTVNPVDK